MIVILTEDIGTGYEFLTLLKDMTFQTPVEVYNTAYGDPEGNGGCSKFRNAIEHLLVDKKLNQGDVIFIAYDNIIPTTAKMVNDRKIFNKQIRECDRLLRKNKVSVYKSSYISIEELILSFDQLLEFASTPDRDLETQDIERYTLFKQYRKTEQAVELNYKRLFQEEIKQGKTIEQCLKDLLRKITKDREFKNFAIADNNIGICWQEDCEQVQPTLKKGKGQYCKTCYAVETVDEPDRKLAKVRLRYLIRRSMFKSKLVDPLNIQLVI